MSIRMLMEDVAIQSLVRRMHMRRTGRRTVEKRGCVDACSGNAICEVPHFVEWFTLCHAAYYADGAKRSEKGDGDFAQEFELLACGCEDGELLCRSICRGRVPYRCEDRRIEWKL
jgi:hypothetical protein